VWRWLQVKHVGGKPELAALMQLKEELGELSSADDLKLKKLVRTTEKEVIQAADVICVTCAGAGDPRLANLRFRKVGPYRNFVVRSLCLITSDSSSFFFCSF